MKMFFVGSVLVMLCLTVVLCYSAMCMAGEEDRLSDQYWKDGGYEDE